MKKNSANGDSTDILFRQSYILPMVQHQGSPFYPKKAKYSIRQVLDIKLSQVS